MKRHWQGDRQGGEDLAFYPTLLTPPTPHLSYGKMPLLDLQNLAAHTTLLIRRSSVKELVSKS